tara:strand:+ start:3444 stop:4805 length:1362 start_codon:yes stop_codon:yes gene_type:complete
MRSRNLFFILFILINFSLFSQQLNTSPFSRYGIGEINTIQSAHYLGWSNTSVAFSDPRYINISNPASYSQFVKHNPLFDVSLTGKNSIYESNYNDEFKTSSGNNFGLNNMFLGLPLTRRWGMVIGIIPMSSVGYEVSSENVVDTSIVTSRFNGDGSINKLLIGNGFNIINKGDSTRLSIGFNASYLFGTLNHISSFIHTSPSSYNSRIHQRSSISGWNFDGGIQFFKRFKTSSKNRYFLRIGSSISMGPNLNSNNDLYAYTFLYNFGVQEIPFDTLENVENKQSEISIPSKMSFGLGFGKNKNSQRSWDLSLQYSISDWSNFNATINLANQTSLPLGPSSTMAIGYRITPNLDWSNNNKSIFTKSSYSFGYHYTESAILLENIGLINNGINFGVSIPLLSSRSLSMMNLSCEVGRLGNIGINKIEENYIKFAIGFTMAPDTRYDRWFRKRKYD